jgi:hypothetical protein
MGAVWAVLLDDAREAHATPEHQSSGWSAAVAHVLWEPQERERCRVGGPEHDPSSVEGADYCAVREHEPRPRPRGWRHGRPGARCTSPRRGHGRSGASPPGRPVAPGQRSRVGGDPVGAAQLAQAHPAGDELALQGLVVANPVDRRRLRLISASGCSSPRRGTAGVTVCSNRRSETRARQPGWTHTREGRRVTSRPCTSEHRRPGACSGTELVGGCHLPLEGDAHGRGDEPAGRRAMCPLSASGRSQVVDRLRTESGHVCSP